MKKIIKKIFFTITFLLFLLVLVWRIDRTFFNPYIPNYNDQIRNDVETLKFTVPKDKETCEQKGGTWKKIGISPREECNLPTQDAGKVCENSKDCEGVCITEAKTLTGKKTKTKGQCSAWIKVVGCHGYVYRGWAQTICVD
jgi:hypothetical protein